MQDGPRRPCHAALSPERPALRNGLCLGQDVLPRRFFRFYRCSAANSPDDPAAGGHYAYAPDRDAGAVRLLRGGADRPGTEKARRAAPRARHGGARHGKYGSHAGRPALAVRALFPWWRAVRRRRAAHLHAPLGEHRGGVQLRRGLRPAADAVRRPLPRDHCRRDRPDGLSAGPAVRVRPRGPPGLFRRNDAAAPESDGRRAAQCAPCDGAV